jgi:environmental stress-induced protein Ves
MRHLRPDSYKVMPWKNGGGSTIELAVFPEHTGLSDRPFQWRVSIADVAADGPFSLFPGYDRHIMLIDGKGMTLQVAPYDVIELDEPFVPAQFSGDRTVHGKLSKGPVRDFNFIVARAFGPSSLRVMRIAGHERLVPIGDLRILHLLDGEMTANSHVVARSDTIILDREEGAELKALGNPVTLALCSIAPI